MTVPLMNGSALCHMHMGRYDDAESLLLEALNKVGYSLAHCLLLLICMAAESMVIGALKCFVFPRVPRMLTLLQI